MSDTESNADSEGEEGEEYSRDTYPSQLMGTLHAAHLDVAMVSSRDDLDALEVARQDDDVAARAIGLQEREKEGTD